MPEILGNVKASLVRGTPGTKILVRKHGGARDGSEEVHPPFCALGSSTIHVEQAQRNSSVANPSLVCNAGRSRRREAIGSRIRYEEVIERCALGDVLGRVVDECLVCDVDGVDFELKVCLRVAGALGDEGFHHLVLPDVVVGALAGVDVKVGLIVGAKGQRDGCLGVTKIDFGEGEIGLVRDRLGVRDGANSGARWNIK